MKDRPKLTGQVCRPDASDTDQGANRAMKTGSIIGDILTALAAAFTVYISVIMTRRIRAVVLKDLYRKVFRFELAACAVFMLLALDIRFGFFTGMEPAVLKAAGWCLRVIVMLAAAVLLFFMGRVTAGCFIRDEAAAKHAVVLGLALENGRPPADLLARLDTAEACLRAHPETVLVLSGGNADGSGTTEAKVMAGILTSHGVPEDRMMLEDQAKTTKENFRNTAQIVDPAEPVMLITSNYHMDRAVRTARSAGLRDVRRLPAPSFVPEFGANILWEAVLELNELTLRQ